MSAVAGRRLAIRAFRTRSQHEVKAVGSRCVSRSACMFNLYNRVDVRRTAFSVDVSRCGAFSRQPVPVRSACTNNERGGEFVEKLEKAFRAAVNERKIKPELLEQMVVLIRDGAAQAETPNPDFNEELDKKMEAVGDLMLYVTGSMLLSVRLATVTNCSFVFLLISKEWKDSRWRGQKFSFLFTIINNFNFNAKKRTLRLYNTTALNHALLSKFLVHKQNTGSCEVFLFPPNILTLITPCGLICH